MNLSLNIGHIGIAKDVLGYGRRLVIWVAGCPFRCRGCIAPEFLEKNSGTDIDINNISLLIKSYSKKINGITISGGEPLWQSESLIELFKIIPNSLDIMIYTGFQVNEINSIQKKCISYADLLVDGRFEIDKKGDFLWKGSSNQNISSPTGKYNKHDLKNISSSKSKGLEVKVVKNNLYFYGVPPGNEINKIINNFNLNGLETT